MNDKAVVRSGDKVVLATFGTYGDVIPFVAVGSALARRGVRVVVATSDHYRDFIEGHGLAFASTAPSEARLCADLGMSVPDIMQAAMHKLTGPRFACQRVVTPYLREGVAQLREACEGATLLLSHVYSFASPIVADLTGTRWRSLCLQPLALLSPRDAPLMSEFLPVHRLQPLLGARAYGGLLNLLARSAKHWVAEVDVVRKELGLPAASKHPLFEGAHAPDGAYGMFDPVLMKAAARDSEHFPPNWVWAGACHSDGTEAPLDDELEQFLEAGEAPIVLTFGTSAVHFAQQAYRDAITAVGQLGVRAVLLTGPSHLGPLPGHVFASPWVSHAKLFARAKVVVHQGGSGTMAQAMRAGVPQLIIPHGNDQPDNAARMERLGAGRTLRSWRVRPASLACQLQHLLSPREGYAQRAGLLKYALMPNDGAEVVADHLLATH